MNVATFVVRSRTRRTQRQEMYGEFAPQMARGECFYNAMIDRTAYVHVTGCFPSHLRKEYTAALRQITRPFRRPSSLDGRNGQVIVNADVVADMGLEAHPMVQVVREKMREGYLIQPSRGFGTRRNFWKIFMFKLALDGTHFGHVTIQGDGAEKRGWE